MHVEQVDLFVRSNQRGNFSVVRRLNTKSKPQHSANFTWVRIWDYLYYHADDVAFATLEPNYVAVDNLTR
jgi:hypothetical protein